MNENKAKNKDYSKGIFIAMCIIEGITYFSVKDNIISGVGRYLAIFVSGLVTYFIGMAYHKSENQISKWTGEEIFIGFIGAIIASWVPTLLGFIFGFGPQHYSGY